MTYLLLHSCTHRHKHVHCSMHFDHSPAYCVLPCLSVSLTVCLFVCLSVYMVLFTTPANQQQSILALMCSVAALLVANQSIQPGAPSRQPTINTNFMTNAEVQIQRIEHEKSQTLAELEPALRRQADLQVKVHSSIEPPKP